MFDGKNSKKEGPRSLPFVSVKSFYRGHSIVKPQIKTRPDGFLYNNLTYGRKNDAN